MRGYQNIGKDYFNESVQNILGLAENEELKTKVYRFAEKHLNSDERIRQKFSIDVKN